jgi:hypothetical protein
MLKESRCTAGCLKKVLKTVSMVSPTRQNFPAMSGGANKKGADARVPVMSWKRNARRSKLSSHARVSNLLILVFCTSSRSRQMKNTVFARFQCLVLKNFRRSWDISTEALLPTKKAYLARKNSFQIAGCIRILRVAYS